MNNEPVVFVIDDEPALLLALSRLLSLSGFNVQSFASAEEFLDIFEPGQQGCMLLDVRLSGMSGVELQRRLRSNHIELPVILMSGHASSELHEMGITDGAVGFLTKPIDSKKLIALLRVTIDDLKNLALKEPQV